LSIKLIIMSWTDKVIYWLGDILEGSTAFVFDNIGNIFNYTAIIVILAGMIYWLRLQNKLVKKENFEQ